MMAFNLTAICITADLQWFVYRCPGVLGRLDIWTFLSNHIMVRGFWGLEKTDLHSVYATRISGA